MNHALVLGGGGSGGWMFHTGVLCALEAAGVYPPGDAELIIGTSAGAPIATLARLGLSAAEIEDRVARPPSSDERRRYMELMRSTKRGWRPVAPHLVRSIRRNGAVVAASGMLPPGIFPTDPLGRVGGIDASTPWPPGLWIPAVRTSDGALVVFGRDEDASLPDAIEASSALPALFKPKAINGHRYFDGGASSPTHADLAVAARPDIVVISSPMTRGTRRPLSLFARSRLSAEVRRIEASGHRAVVIEPPTHADSLFREFPRHRWSAGAEILELGRLAAASALER